MIAETVYNVYQALPETEKDRLRIMLDADYKKIGAKPVDGGQLTLEECTDQVMKILNKQKQERFVSKQLTVV